MPASSKSQGLNWTRMWRKNQNAFIDLTLCASSVISFSPQSWIVVEQKYENGKKDFNFFSHILFPNQPITFWIWVHNFQWECYIKCFHILGKSKKRACYSQRVPKIVVTNRFNTCNKLFPWQIFWSFPWKKKVDQQKYRKVAF